MLNGKYVILLDAGHYDYYNQGVVKTYWESINNWTQHLLLKEELEKLGFVVYTTRANQEKDLALYDRGYQCKKYNADVFLSIHSNASGNASIKGMQVYYSYGVNNMAYGTEIAKAVASVMGNGVNAVYTVKSDIGDYNYYGVLRGAYAAGCKDCFIVERGFHTNAQECQWLMDNNNLRKIAVALADYFKNKYYGKDDKKVRYFKLLTTMNVRKTPNGDVLGTLNAGTEVSGTELTATDSGTQWLKITYSGQTAYVAVLPESKGYAKETTPVETDYKALYEAQKARADKLDAANLILEAELSKAQDKYSKLVVGIKALLG